MAGGDDDRGMGARTTRRAAGVLVLASLLLAVLVLISDPSAGGWPHPDLRAEPPYRMFVLVVGGGLLALTVVGVIRRHPPRLREYAALAVVAIVATWLSGYRQAGAQPCCETGWVFGFGYPFEYRFDGVSPAARIRPEEAEVLLRQTGGGGRIEPPALIADLLFWGYATLLAYLPIRTVVHHRRVRRAAGVPLDHADGSGQRR
jgi:hypothetical protein